MVCLAVWMSYSGRSLMDKAFIMVLPVAMFVASGFEHQYRKHVYDSYGYCNTRFCYTGVLDRGWFVSGKFFSPDRDELHH
ncbi:formate transporter [Salmonella enterica subsp. enterica]|uniref:Formate transporter n=1 Tax=Salmonella enterica I TaxID=59201 RepID=A0A3S4IVM4_SALET|nr:formate transporter [Salmonella enterica subsp. enterica]